MDFEEIRLIVSKAIEQTKTHQIDLLMRWLDGVLSKYRESTLPSNTVSAKISNDQCFTCPCGRSFSTEITIRETSHVESSSPPGTPLLSVKTDLKNQQYSHESISKRQRGLIVDTPSTTVATLNSSSLISSWPTANIKNYGNGPEIMNHESHRTESDIEVSSDESRCLDDIDVVLSPDKAGISNFIYSNELWTTPSLSSAANSTIASSTNNHDDDRFEHAQMITLKPVNNEPLSPSPALIHDGEMGKTVAIIHRRPMLVAFTDPRACSPTGPTHFKCTQCHETFDSLLLGQDHANHGMCTPDATANAPESSDSQQSPAVSPLFDAFQDELDEGITTRLDTKAACPICNKVFSSVHTMVRHKTSIHDRQVRYGCNICGRFFFRKDKLTSHMVYHQDFDTYVCCFCSVGCKSRMLMRQHLKRDHVISSEDTRLNDILSRCQVKKSLNLETNMSVAYGADRQITSLKRNINTISTDNDIKQTVTISSN
ncbi:unnamed protein product [Rotaria magnacalcarata]|uniref:C2H2-type domain-containing protein n=2 Tax=Rotaria magnacalcarata TaxID=392030 RepID=A0A819SKC8_9BILA|nr:unnamed protein product [Rotaria magnacalcarata]CAF2252384.1 unnamed protein product [Rotaria magnacalcarata]CAF3847702.1 unnamed protein product [Rotaria magnacalcarata]CAF4057873.1 unnamed protein product [Rotaria magnacalcarata]